MTDMQTDFDLVVKRLPLSREMFGVSWGNLTREQRAQYEAEWRRRNPDKLAATLERNRESGKDQARARKADPAYRAEINRKAKEWRAANPGTVKGYYRRYRLKAEYGLTEAQYDAMVGAQQGKCAICGNQKGSARSRRRDEKLCVDHDHKTGVVRGLLCHHCNMMLGHVNDDVEKLRKGIEYLMAHRQTEAA